MPPLFVAPEEHPTCPYEEEREDDDPDAEPDYGSVVWI